MVAVVKANHVQENSKNITQLNDQKNEIMAKEPKYLGLMDILILQDHQKTINQHNHLTPSLYANVIVVVDGTTWQRNVLCL